MLGKQCKVKKEGVFEGEDWSNPENRDEIISKKIFLPNSAVHLQDGSGMSKKT